MQRWSNLDRATKWILGFCGALIVLGIVTTVIDRRNEARNATARAEVEAQRRELEANAEKMRREALERWNEIEANVNRARGEKERQDAE